MPADTARETGALGTTITCPCGHAETVEATGVYRVVPWPRWHVDPATSTVSVVDAPRYICEPCWEAWPDGDDTPGGDLPCAVCGTTSDRCADLHEADSDACCSGCRHPFTTTEAQEGHSDA